MTLLQKLLFSITFYCLFLSCNVIDPPVTDEEAKAFAKEIETSFAKKNPSVFNDLIDPSTFRERVKDAGKGKVENSVLNEITKGLEKRKLGNEILQLLGEEGTYELVKHYKEDNEQHLLFRMYGSSGLNYHDMELVRRGDKLKVADLYVYITGENMSKTLADVSIGMQSYYKDNMRTADANNKEILELRKMITTKRFEEAKEKFDGLPNELKKQKNFQLMNIMILSEVDHDAYKEAINTFAKRFPNEPNLYLVMIDHHFLQEDYKAALNDVDQLDALINKDPFLDLYRGNIYNAMDDSEMAIKHFERLEKNMPAFGDGIIELAALYLKTDQQAKAKDLMAKHKQHLPEAKLNIISILYPDFKM
ncbi:tetratricopeptide repeat protein [Aridibaculum aurantiacum]|uniref:tetratricopeptide repeat protein n=1 Tax=Aridibaculum aurantiacum TaxID=2810307 RepID=UPI001A9628FA|nr:hypothetical protein [Aridibaculum aurantiacum]